MTYEEWRDALESITEAWNEFCSRMENAASKIQELWADIQEMAYSKPSIPPKKYGTRKRKDNLFHNQIVKCYRAERKIQKHRPYFRRVF